MPRLSDIPKEDPTPLIEAIEGACIICKKPAGKYLMCRKCEKEKTEIKD